MAQIINTNIASLNAQRNLTSSQSANATALERLSSGLRINSAKDDAAGLAISTRFESQTRGLNQAIRNAGDGISLAQTAEGALGTMTDNLQRIRELAVQSANATNSDEDRAALQQEVRALVAEITRTGEETNFNGRNLFDGKFNGTFQIGANAGQTVQVQIQELTAARLGSSSQVGVSALGTGNALQNGDLVINGVSIDPSVAGDDTASVFNNGASAIAKAAAINAKTDQTGVSATVNTNVAAGTAMEPEATSGIVKLNGVEFNVSTGGQDASVDRDSVISAINARSGQTGITARDGGDAGGVILEAKDGRNITVEFGDGTLTSASTGLSEGTSYGGYTLTSRDGSAIEIAGGQGTGTGDIRNSGLTAGVYAGRVASVTSTITDAGTSTFETSTEFTTGEFNIGENTQINATNNAFELSVDGSDFANFRLGTNFDAGSGNGRYSNAEELAAQINDALTNEDNTAFAANESFRNDDGSAMFTAVANADETITFITTAEGPNSNIVARTGAGSINIPTLSDSTMGANGETLQTFTLETKFDGNNRFTTAGDIVIDFINGAGTDQMTLAVDSDDAANGIGYTAEEMAGLINTQLATDGINATASVGDDGVSVVITANPGSVDPYTSIVDGGTDAEATELQSNFQQLSNGSSVITDVDEFAQLIGQAGDGNVGFAVDGAAAQDVNFGATAALAYEAFTGEVGSFADDLAAAQDNTLSAEDQAEALSVFMNNVFATQAAGTGITATADGDQVVISSNTGGTVGISQGAADPVGTDAALVNGEADSVEVGAVAGFTVTGNYSVDEEGYFLSGDPDPSNPEIEPQRAALQITEGLNDTFSIALDGGTSQEITIAAGSYETMDDLATAINTALAGPSTTTTEATSAEITGIVDVSALDLADFDFDGNADLVFDLSLNGGAPVTITVDTDYSGEATVADAVAATLADIQGQINTEFGSNLIEVGLNDDNQIVFSTIATGTDASLEVDNAAGGAAVVGIADAGPVTGADEGSTTSASATASVSADNQSLIFTSALEGATSQVELTNGTFAVEGGFVAGSTVVLETEPAVLTTGDLILNGVAIRGAAARDDSFSDTVALSSNAAGSGISVAAAINASTDRTGVSAEVNATIVNGGIISDADPRAETGSTGEVIVNNVKTAPITLTGDEGRDRKTAIDAINAVSGQTGVVASDNGESITLTAADGRNISVAIDNRLAANREAGFDSSNFGNAIGLKASETGIGEADISGSSATYANTAGTTYSSVKLSAASEIRIEAGENGPEALRALGFQLGTYGGGFDGQFLKDVDISTFEGAQEAITAIDNALSTVASQRAELGALQNRFESTVANLAVTAENLTAANSRIRDADFAAETAELSRTQVLQQAGISILAQANQRPQQVLSLLG